MLEMKETLEMRKSKSWNWKQSSRKRKIKCPFLHGEISAKSQGNLGLLLPKGVLFPVKVLLRPQHLSVCIPDLFLSTSVMNRTRKTVAESNINSWFFLWVFCRVIWNRTKGLFKTSSCSWNWEFILKNDIHIPCTLQALSSSDGGWLNS